MTRDEQPQKTVLVTGGAGYVGSHSTLLLLSDPIYQVIVVDNCPIDSMQSSRTNHLDSNGNDIKSTCSVELPESLIRVQQLAKRSLTAFYNINLVDCDQLEIVFHEHKIDAVIHFAALKSIPESLTMPLEYYTNNLNGTINLLNAMKRHGCKNMIFSSSATVYGLPEYLPVDEKHPVGKNILNPYGRTKCMVEDILRDLSNINAMTLDNRQQINNWNIISLRYFNPVGAHPSGFIGEYNQQVPNNLMPYVSQVAFGKREKLFVFGNDFDTIDGTGVRDYIHIMDLASGHMNALEKLLSNKKQGEPGFKVYNLGTGRGYSVIEVIKTFEEVNKVKVPYEITGRRDGDAGEVYADATLAFKELGWSAKYSLIEMVRDTYRWQMKYPDGFKSEIDKEDLKLTV